MSCCEERDKRNEECSQPEFLKDEPENCGPEQICRCHGNRVEKHSCCCEKHK